MDFRNNRAAGWWLSADRLNWSFSWSVAHSLRWYLLSSKKGVEVETANELSIGDVIFYDFNGDGKFQHSTIVVLKQDGEVYVNAHTSDSFERHYSYKDSSAYTPNCKYTFIHIIE